MNTNNKPLAANFAETQSAFYILDNGDLKVEDAALLWSNFAGAANKFGNTQRTFNLVLSEEAASKLREAGWRVKTIIARDEEDVDAFIVEVVVNMDSEWPPKLEVCSEFNGIKTRANYGVERVADLDGKGYVNHSVVVHPRPSTMKAYLKTLICVEGQAYNSDDFGGRYSEYSSASVPVIDDEVPWN